MYPICVLINPDKSDIWLSCWFPGLQNASIKYANVCRILTALHCTVNCPGQSKNHPNKKEGLDRTAVELNSS